MLCVQIAKMLRCTAMLSYHLNHATLCSSSKILYWCWSVFVCSAIFVLRLTKYGYLR